MGTKYSTNATSGYNATPPDDDGTVSEANKVKWSTIKTKLTDTLKTFAEAINSDLVTHFDVGPTAITSNTTLGASHYSQIIQVSGAAVTLTLTDAATLAAGWHCRIVNTDSSNNVTIGRATGADTINGSAANFTLTALHAIDVFVVAAGNGFQVRSAVISPATTDTAQTISAVKTLTNKLVFAEGADIASAATTDIWAATGNTVHVTGTTTITSFGTASQAGDWRRVIFDGALTLTHAANLNLPGAANITTAAGDSCLVYADTASQHDVLSYTRADGFSVKDGSTEVFTSSGTFTAKKTGTHTVIICGGGGGGGAGGTGNGANSGGGGGGGGSGLTIWFRQSLTKGTGYTVTIGAGGASATNGGTTTFDATSTSGGNAGTTGGNPTAGAGGAANASSGGGAGSGSSAGSPGGSGAASAAGGAGGAGAAVPAGGGGSGGGASSFFGSGGAGTNGSGAQSTIGGVGGTTGYYGAGGGGGAGGGSDNGTAGGAGGAGAGGICIVISHP